PDVQYLDKKIEDYEVEDKRRKDFLESVNKFAAFIENGDIFPDMAGIRPKLEGPNDGFRDFIIKEESDKGFPGFINLIGIESPGLTSALSIAKYVENLLKICDN
ncbi:MAG: NAD(P)/FAD-dependent oxidoreductase, partial [Candidatus Omnitrophota bacterium]